MFIALSAILAVAVVVLAVAWMQARRRIEVSAALEEERSEQLKVAQEALRAAEADGVTRARERDDALARELRVKRDAAEVAKRLDEVARERDQVTTTRDELASERDGLVSERAGLVSERDSLVSERDALAQECERLRIAPVGDGSVSMDGELVWALTLARIDRLWQVSVASGVTAASPLIGSSSLLADALEILVAAAREEAGATVELTYVGGDDVEGSTAATVACLCEEMIAAAVDGADETSVGVEVTDDDVFVSIVATSDGQDVAVPGPSALLVDGRYRVARVRG